MRPLRKDNPVEAQKIVKIAARLIVGAGTSKIIGTIIANNVEPENVRDKVAVTAGTIAVSAMVADAAKTYTDQKIEEAFELYAKLRNRNYSGPEDPTITVTVK